MEATVTVVAKPKRVLAKDKFTNNASRLRKWICACQSHITNADTGSKRNGPYVIRAAGDIDVQCNVCETSFFRDDSSTGRRIFRGCTHCSNPDAHVHIEDLPEPIPVPQAIKSAIVSSLIKPVQIAVEDEPTEDEQTEAFMDTDDDLWEQSMKALPDADEPEDADAIFEELEADA